MVRRDYASEIKAELAASIGYALDQIDRELNDPEWRAGLLVNQRGREKPKYSFMPGQHKVRFWTSDGWDSKDPQGLNPRVNKKSYKATIKKGR